MKDNFEYFPRYTKKEYALLLEMSIDAHDGLIDRLHGSKRDYRIQSFFHKRYPHAYRAITCPLNDVPLHINHTDKAVETIAQWRLRLAK